MAFKNILDMHTHTDNSPDGHHGATLMCEYAVKSGLRAIAFTDHCECNAYVTERYNVSSRQSFFEATKQKDIFAGFIVVVAGIELGQPMQDPAARDTALTRPYDFTLASLHNVAGKPDFYLIDFNAPENDIRTLIGRYFEELTDMCRWGGFDSLAHITYPFRYLGKFETDVTPEDFKPQIDEILSLLVAGGKALEINTSGPRYGTDILPPLWLLKRFRELGGELLTIGSDAHRFGDVGGGVPDGMKLALRAGFQYVTLYQDHVPIPIRIE